MTVRAKFKVRRIEIAIGSRQSRDEHGKFMNHYKQAEMRTVVLAPVYHYGDPDHENSRFWDDSPICQGTRTPVVDHYTPGIGNRWSQRYGRGRCSICGQDVTCHADGSAIGHLMPRGIAKAARRG